MKGYAKKQATRYIKDGYIRKGITMESWINNYSDPQTCETVVHPKEAKVEKAIIRRAYRSGWDGCHWDHPLHVIDEV